MSLNKIIAKENKGKQKGLPKLKAILTNPNKERCPVLDETELNQLKVLLKNAIQKSELEPKTFATKNGICLGLESSLRKINSQSSSCVFISLGIKPNYIVSLIARNAQNKDKKQPVFAQPKLESFIQEIFGIQALCMVFPKDLSLISEHISDWVEKRQKREKDKVRLATNSIKKKAKKRKILETGEIENKKKSKHTKTDEPMSWSGNFISLESNREKKDSKLDGKDAIDALAEIIEKIPATTNTLLKTEEKAEPMECDKDLPSIEKNDETDSDDFLAEYKPLIVHKIKGNPNKIKKKRKKNKNPMKK